MDFSDLEMRFYELLDKLPVGIEFYHPYVVHFAIVLPIIALLFQWLNVLNSDKGYMHVSNILFYTGILFIFLAFITGKAAAPDVKPLLSIDGQNFFDKHKAVGTYIALLYLTSMLLKFLTIGIKKAWLRHVTTAFTIISFLALLYGAKLGHDLVFQYGAGVEVFENY